MRSFLDCRSREHHIWGLTWIAHTQHGANWAQVHLWKHWWPDDVMLVTSASGSKEIMDAVSSIFSRNMRSSALTAINRLVKSTKTTINPASLQLRQHKSFLQKRHKAKKQVSSQLKCADCCVQLVLRVLPLCADMLPRQHFYRTSKRCYGG